MYDGQVYIDQFAYECMLERLNSESSTDQRGELIDMGLFYDDAWLMDSAVVENMIANKGNWDIYLVFVDPLHPMKFIRRKISSYFSRNKAELAGNYMRRLAAKDQRGTIKISNQLYGSQSHN